MRQERATVTRERLLRAAALEFAQCGYSGTSLQAVCRTAEVSMGALTFHFPAKSALAAAVARAGAAQARSLADRAAACTGDSLAAVAGLSCKLASLLARCPLARASARLDSEQVAAAGAWSEAWGPAVRRLLQHACEEGQLSTEVAVETVIQLNAHLLHGVAVALRKFPEGGAAEHLERIWAAVMCGLRTSSSAAG
ncbi:TetR family transcriptional regulator [Streptomyces spirodelae]|uniref:TetR family transcriptional regulator n=1 Tax=Streptomyces spirodelae TaxID=2812904 RepID=A0ABS3WRU2_9ACTN|nr:TetR family transcriptional regulator [Streptomyces spirodelae]MBO8185850.1 TetR family transcriptional regulator [Streptomyces spirodelae]